VATASRMTLEEFLKLPETEPYSEFVNGEVVQKTGGSLTHSLWQMLLSIAFGGYLGEHPTALGGPDLTCIFGPGGREYALIPDFALVSMQRLRGQRGDGPFHDARLVWVINPEARTVMVFDSPTQLRILHEHDELDGGDVLPGFRVPVSEILPPANLLAGEEAARP
jgi:Uma2 family endonuclease